MSTRWIPLLEYAVKNGVSMSTLRRHVKSGKIKFKHENGRYLVPEEGIATQSADAAEESGQQNLFWTSEIGMPVEAAAPESDLSLESFWGDSDSQTSAAPQEVDRTLLRLQELENEIMQLREENAELRMLVTTYEEAVGTEKPVGLTSEFSSETDKENRTAFHA